MYKYIYEENRFCLLNFWPWGGGGGCAFHASPSGTVLRTKAPLSVAELPRAIARTGRSSHLLCFWRRGGDCAFHASPSGTVLRTSRPIGRRTPAGYRPYRSFFSSFVLLAERGRFELPVPTSGTTDFESAAFDHSATSP